MPLQPSESARDRLIAAGKLIPAAGPRHFPVRRRIDGPSTQAVLDELREDRM